MNPIDKELKARAESAESALSLLTAKLAQCEEKLASVAQERNDSWADVTRVRIQLAILQAAHAKALEDGKRK